MRRLILLVPIILLPSALGGYVLHDEWHYAVKMPPEGYYLEVAPGDSLTTLSERLATDGVIRSAWMLNLYGRATGLDARLHSGEYRLTGSLTAAQVLDLISRGDVVSYNVTLPEGITLARAIKILSSAPGLDAVLTGPDDRRLLELAEGRQSAEGLFLPETYHYVRGTSDWEILRRAHADLMATLNRLWVGRLLSLPYEEPYEALIMASIIERETGVPGERPQVAGVFIRRLQRGMRLQTDPTVIYGLGTDFDGNLTRAHLRDADNPIQYLPARRAATDPDRARGCIGTAGRNEARGRQRPLFRCPRRWYTCVQRHTGTTPAAR